MVSSTMLYDYFMLPEISCWASQFETSDQLHAAANDKGFLINLYKEDDVVQTLAGLVYYLPRSSLPTEDIKITYASIITTTLEKALEQKLALPIASTLVFIVNNIASLKYSYPQSLKSRFDVAVAALQANYSTNKESRLPEMAPAPGMAGTWRWLKDLRLHKYWPLFSRWCYEQMLALDESNIDFLVQSVGGSPVTKGARGKIVRSVLALTQRENKIQQLTQKVKQNNASLDELIAVTTEMLRTPLKRTKDLNDLPQLLLDTIHYIVDECLWKKDFTQCTRIKVNQLLTSASTSLAFSYDERKTMEQRLEDLEARHLSIVWLDGVNSVCFWGPALKSTLNSRIAVERSSKEPQEICTSQRRDLSKHRSG